MNDTLAIKNVHLAGLACVSLLAVVGAGFTGIYMNKKQQDMKKKNKKKMSKKASSSSLSSSSSETESENSYERMNSSLTNYELPVSARTIEGRRNSFGRRASFQRLPAKSCDQIVSPIIERIATEALIDDVPLIVGIAGGTGSGKTTLSQAIYENLGADFVTYLAHDNYYKDLSHLQKSERAATNFDHPDSLDTNLLIEHLKQLQAGKSAMIPQYDFTTHTRVTDQAKEVVPRRVILVEGILIFSEPELVKMIDIKVFVDTEADIRLIRRIQRDVKDRGRDIDSIVSQYVTTVRPMHLEFVEPSKRVADIIVPTGINAVALDLVISRLRFEIGV